MILDTEQWTCTLPLARPLYAGAVGAAVPAESTDAAATTAESSHTCIGIAPRGGHSANFCVCAGRPAVYIFGGRDFQDDGGEFRHFGRNDACVCSIPFPSAIDSPLCSCSRSYLLYLDAPKREELSAYSDGSFSLA